MDNNDDNPRSSPAEGLFSTDYYGRSLNVLETALNEVAAYRSWRVLDPGQEQPIDARYAAMPSLTRRDIRECAPQDFLPHNRKINLGLANEQVELVKTSGTTGIRVTVIWNQEWWNASERASWKLNSRIAKIATGDHKEAILASPLNVGFVSDDVMLPMEKRRVSRFLFLNEMTNPSSWTSEYMDRMIRELEVFKPVILEANPSLLAKLCRYVAASKKMIFQPGAIVLTYEYPTRFHYQQIRRVFDVPIVSSHGSTETGYVFMQCEEGKFHQNSEFCRVDFQPLEPGKGDPALGRILVTTFNNPWYYMVRLDLEDLVRLDDQASCPCGRHSGLILSAIEGRVKNVTLTCKGSMVTLRQLDDALSILEGVDEYKLDQHAKDGYRLHLVTQRADKNKLGKEAREILSQLYGEEAKISTVFQTAIAPETSGKYNISRTLFPLEL